MDVCSWQNAYLWDEFHKKGITALGWDFLGDLNDYDNQEDIEVVLQQYENTTKSKKNDSNANFNFLENMAIGDVVFVKQGIDKLIGYGIITSDFYLLIIQEKF